ncbi:hypothetical protein GGS23DRAFT_554568 [Durotheca rogersii]|uniref:uncharacterized protein n=1 Tax=Durotheca rogersii TaxID=419775 RepID=UPI00221ED9C2|nr:uncharacterized protein GGS23DRAFT_554568 [Durotheca rogersii]KAI5865912.1 hypothetical protein GGS23DRAFT_554568 [Durotheca rogersii]
MRMGTRAWVEDGDEVDYADAHVRSVDRIAATFFFPPCLFSFLASFVGCVPSFRPLLAFGPVGEPYRLVTEIDRDGWLSRWTSGRVWMDDGWMLCSAIPLFYRVLFSSPRISRPSSWTSPFLSYCCCFGSGLGQREPLSSDWQFVSLFPPRP